MVIFDSPQSVHKVGPRSTCVPNIAASSASAGHIPTGMFRNPDSDVYLHLTCRKGPESSVGVFSVLIGGSRGQHTVTKTKCLAMSISQRKFCGVANVVYGGAVCCCKVLLSEH